VVVISGRAGEVERDALRLGAHAVLPKPLVLPDLSRAVGAEVATASAAAAHAVAAPAAAPATVAGACRTMLVVDDDAGVRDVLQEMLTANGYQSYAVGDGAAALRAVVMGSFDVILLDIDMPGLSGLETLVAIRALAPDTSVIMVSGTESEVVARNALDKGAFDYIMKPVDLQRLRSVVDAALTFKTR
jgi:CheY-like chemotaxis protein